MDYSDDVGTTKVLNSKDCGLPHTPDEELNETALQKRRREMSNRVIEIETGSPPSVKRECSGLTASTSRSRTPRALYPLVKRCRRCCCCRFRMPRAVALVVESEYFDYTIGLFILLNAVLIGVQADYGIRNLDSREPPIFQHLELMFVIGFSVELALRLLTYGFNFFICDAWRWNVFDCVVVFEQTLNQCLGLLDGEGTGERNLSFIRIVRVFRLVRIIRLVRMLRLIRELRTMVDSIANTLRSLFWTLILMSLMLFVVGVHYTQLVTEHGRENPELLAEGRDLRKWFGSLPRAILSLYQAMTGGVDWDILVLPLIDDIHPIHAVFFALFIAVSVLALMNIITGFFVESALKNTRIANDVDMVNSMRQLFTVIDKEDTGQVSWTQFERHLQNPQMELYFQAVDLDISEAKGLFRLLDLDENGEISADEFVMGCLRLRGPAKAIDLATLMFENRRMRQHWKAQVETLQGLVAGLITALTGCSDDIGRCP